MKSVAGGGRVKARGDARHGALSDPTFRLVFGGAFASNIGTWMQNVVLGAFAYDLTESPRFVGVLIFAQLGPLLVLSLLGGALADRFDRRRLIVAVAVQQMALSAVLAWVVRGPDPSQTSIVVLVAAIGVGQALFIPTYTALLPGLVERRHLSSAISLSSAQMNAARVIGPAIGAALYAATGPEWVFGTNALTYGFIIAAMLVARLPASSSESVAARGVRAALSGIDLARRDPVVRRCLITITAFSFACLPFIGQFPTIAERNLGIDASSSGYGWLFATFGLGGVTGALLVGRPALARRLEGTTRAGLVVFAAGLASLALLRSPVPAFPVVLLVGACYFATVTSLQTVIQLRVDDAVRGRVMALWVMGWGGTVPVGGLVAGFAIEATSITAVLLAGAVVALVLVAYADLRSSPKPA